MHAQPLVYAGHGTWTCAIAISSPASLSLAGLDYGSSIRSTFGAWHCIYGRMVSGTQVLPPEAQHSHRVIRS